jgi:hypothetical protein
MRKTLFVFIALIVALDAVAQVPMPIHVIPVIGKMKGGAGTDWVSDVMISNVSDRNATVGVRYFPANQANTFDGSFPKSLNLPARNSVLAKDAVATWFATAGTSTSGILVIADVTPVNCSAPADIALVATSRTYNAADKSKTYGQSIPSNWAGVNFTRARTFLTGIRQESGVPGYRSNVGVANLSTVQIGVTITFYGQKGNVVATAKKTIPPLSLGQWALGDLGVASLPASGAWASVVMDASSIKIDPCDDDATFACMSRCGDGCGGKYSFSKSGAFIAYVSKVDNGSGDAEFLPGIVDFESFNNSCPDSIGQTPAANFIQKFGLDKPPTFRKIPR